MRKYSFLFHLAFGLIAVLPQGGAINALELKIATLAPAGSAWMTVFEKMAAEVRAKTGGRVTIRYFAYGQQGDERDAVRKIKLGQLDGAALTATGLAMIDESIRVFELPSFFANSEEIDFVADKTWTHFEKKFDKKGFTLGERSETGWTYFYSKTKITTLDELRSQKTWLWGDDQIAGALFKKLGLNGVPLGIPEVEPALTTGRLTACHGTPMAAVALQWYTKIKYATQMPVNFGIGAIVYSNETLKKISAADRKILDAAEKAAGKQIRKVLRKTNTDALATMQRKGVTVTATPAATIAEFNRAAGEIWKELGGKVYAPDELELVTRYRTEYRSKRK